MPVKRPKPEPIEMKPGALVAYVRDPSLYGPLEITEVTFRGLIYCDDADDRRVGPFQPHELDDAGRYYTTSQAGLPS